MAAKFDIRNVTVENIGTTPMWFKTAITLVVMVAIMGTAYWKDTLPQLDQIEKARKREVDLRAEFEGKQQKAANLDALKRQLEVIRQTMSEMQQKLPSKTEVPDLLQSVSQAGLGAGLEFDTFKPGSERPVEFYVELPIQIRVNGEYHEFGKFISAVAGLERIVTNHDVKIRHSTAKGGKLVMETTAKTYRYMDEKEEEAATSAQSKAKSKGKAPAPTAKKK